MASAPGKRIDLKDETYGLMLSSKRGRYGFYLITTGYHLFRINHVFRSDFDGDKGTMTVELNEVPLPAEKCIYVGPDLTVQEVTAEQALCD